MRRRDEEKNECAASCYGMERCGDGSAFFALYIKCFKMLIDDAAQLTYRSVEDDSSPGLKWL